MPSPAKRKRGEDYDESSSGEEEDEVSSGFRVQAEVLDDDSWVEIFSFLADEKRTLARMASFNKRFYRLIQKFLYEWIWIDRYTYTKGGSGRAFLPLIRPLEYFKEERRNYPLVHTRAFEFNVWSSERNEFPHFDSFVQLTFPHFGNHLEMAFLGSQAFGLNHLTTIFACCRNIKSLGLNCLQGLRDLGPSDQLIAGFGRLEHLFLRETTADCGTWETFWKGVPLPSLRHFSNHISSRPVRSLFSLKFIDTLLSQTRCLEIFEIHLAGDASTNIDAPRTPSFPIENLQSVCFMLHEWRGAPPEYATNLMKSCPPLRQIRTNACFDPTIIGRHRLETLRLVIHKGTPLSSSQSLSDLISRIGGSVTKLSFRCDFRLSAKALRTIAEACPLLQEFEMDFVPPDFGDPFLADMLHDLDGHHLDGAFLDEFIRRTPQLRALYPISQWDMILFPPEEEYDEYGDRIQQDSDDEDKEDSYPPEHRDWLRRVGKIGRIDMQMKLPDLLYPFANR